jgi:Flp pilus assembly protein TadG
MKTRFHRRWKRRRGAAAVEFAVSLPILLAFFVFFLEFARVEQIRHTVATAAYEGARQGIVEGGSADDALQTAERILGAVQVRDAEVVVTPSTITSETTAVQVSITVPMAGNAWVTAFFLDDIDIKSTVSLRKG